MKFDIKSRWSDDVLFGLETDSLKLAVEAGVKSGAVLTGAVLTPIRDDLWAVLSAAPSEVMGLRQAILDGKIDGRTYEGSCACLIGTLANVRQCKFNAIPGLLPNGSRPIEQFFCAINPGDTPENSQFCKLALDWVDQWLSNMHAAFGQAAKPC